MPDIFNKQEETKPIIGPIDPAPQKEAAPIKKQALVQSSGSNPGNQKNLGLFTTFCRSPKGVVLAEQDEDEKIELVIRRDFATNIPWIVSTIVLLFIPLLIRFIFHTINFPIPTFPPRFVTAFNIFYYLVTIGFAFSNYITWFYTIGVITNKRAVDIDFVDVSSVNFAAAELRDVIDAKYSQNGFLQSFFDFGDVDLVIQAPKETLIYDKAPKPSEVAGIIRDLIGNK